MIRCSFSADRREKCEEDERPGNDRYRAGPRPSGGPPHASTSEDEHAYEQRQVEQSDPRGYLLRARRQTRRPRHELVAALELRVEEPYAPRGATLSEQICESGTGIEREGSCQREHRCEGDHDRALQVRSRAPRGETSGEKCEREQEGSVLDRRAPRERDPRPSGALPPLAGRRGRGPRQR